MRQHDILRLNEFLTEHSMHTCDMTGHWHVVVVACNLCHATEVYGAESEAAREAALDAHMKTIAAALMPSVGGM